MNGRTNQTEFSLMDYIDYRISFIYQGILIEVKLRQNYQNKSYLEFNNHYLSINKNSNNIMEYI